MKAVNQLFQKRIKSLKFSEEAIRRHPNEFKEIREILDRVTREPVDIDDYYPLAARLARLLETMGPGTVFHCYYLENIDPCKACQARYFRYICRDLQEQIAAFNHWRRNQQQIRLVQ